jgi:hypothetical protein
MLTFNAGFILKPDIIDRLTEQNINYTFKYNWKRNNSIFNKGFGEITFENEQDKLAFVMRWR